MICLLMCATLMAGASAEKSLSYANAHELATQQNRPMLILVGADWCPACRTMKHNTLSSMQHEGKLKEVVFGIVNIDTEPELAAQMMRSSTIPQLILYTPAPQGWYRMYLHGAQSEDRIEGMIARGIEMQRRDRALANKAQHDKSESPASASIADD